jgi:hypothetical protein
MQRAGSLTVATRLRLNGHEYRCKASCTGPLAMYSSFALLTSEQEAGHGVDEQDGHRAARHSISYLWILLLSFASPAVVLPAGHDASLSKSGTCAAGCPPPLPRRRASRIRPVSGACYDRPAISRDPSIAVAISTSRFHPRLSSSPSGCALIRYQLLPSARRSCHRPPYRC